MEQPGKKVGHKVIEACPACGVPRNEWPGEGVLRQGTLYCCTGCANGTGCVCRKPSETIAPRSGSAGCVQPTPPDREMR